MKTTQLSKEPLKKLKLKGPKLSRRQIGRAPRPKILRRYHREAVEEICAEEDRLWMELVRKVLSTPELVSNPLTSSS